MDRFKQAQTIMHKFAISTGLSPVGATHSGSHRYLWTDAFAVCNYLGFYRQSAQPIWLQRAKDLVDQVHQTLGQHRPQSTHHGWLSGLDEDQARCHPTRGGLRIGKALDESQLHEPINETLQWQQDGQYFHYLTKWMHALNCLSRVSGEVIYNQWAIELAKVAHRAFVHTLRDGTKRIYWKMSIDLSRPLVASMGQHDPLDGLLTYLQLHQAATQQPNNLSQPRLDSEIADMLAICAEHNWVSDDALGIGGLLADAFKLLQISDQHPGDHSVRLAGLLDDIEYSLHAFLGHNSLAHSAEHRLAFRELGLAIGLQAINKMQHHIKQNPAHFAGKSPLPGLLTKLAVFEPIHTRIESFWLSPQHQKPNSWLDHSDINNVMLATSLLPDGYLQLSQAGQLT
ncbi:MAG: hypothetical protein ACJA13_000192 [Paraglaciecola sp.]|jgi:hypothetical protein